jgi:hypothetical protein
MNIKQKHFTRNMLLCFISGKRFVAPAPPPAKFIVHHQDLPALQNKLHTLVFSESFPLAFLIFALKVNIATRVPTPYSCVPDGPVNATNFEPSAFTM